MVEENRRLCVTSIKRFFDEDGNLMPTNEWTAEMSAQVASIEIVKRNQTAADIVIRVRFWNKNQALELMHKHLRLLVRDPNEGYLDVPAFLMNGKKPSMCVKLCVGDRVCHRLGNGTRLRGLYRSRPRATRCL